MSEYGEVRYDTHDRERVEERLAENSLYKPIGLEALFAEVNDIGEINMGSIVRVGSITISNRPPLEYLVKTRKQ